MPDASWWILEGVLAAALALCALLGLLSAGRVGVQTPYGSFLFTFAIGFWALLCGQLVRCAAVLVLDERLPSPSIDDALDLFGWASILLGFALFGIRFSAVGSLRRRLARLSLFLVPPLAGALLLFLLVLHPGADLSQPRTQLRMAYLAIDGIGFGFILMNLKRFLALREAALGRLFVLLGLALLLNTLSDIERAYARARGFDPALADFVTPLAGIVAVAAMVVNHRMLARVPDAEARFSDPSLSLEQRYLRDVTERLRGLVGELADALVLAAATRALDEHGVRHAVRDGQVVADAPAEVWRDVLLRVRDDARRHVGPVVLPQFEDVAASYGPPLAYLRGSAA